MGTLSAIRQNHRALIAASLVAGSLGGCDALSLSNPGRKSRFRFRKRYGTRCPVRPSRLPPGPFLFLALLGLTLVSPPWMMGQDIRDLERGHRVRMTPSDGPSLEGSFLGLGPGGLSLLDSSEGEYTIPVASLRLLEMSAGRNRKGGALVGGAIGLAAGLLLGEAISGDCFWDCDDFYGIGGDGLAEANATGMRALLGGVILGGIGAGVGAFFAPERWVSIDLDSVGRITPMVRMRR